MTDRIKITTRRRSKPTFEQTAERRHDDFQRRLDAVARIEVALPTVRQEYRDYLQEVLDRSDRAHPVELERLASMAEGYLSRFMPTGEALTELAAKDAADLFGPPGLVGQQPTISPKEDGMTQALARQAGGALQAGDFTREQVALLKRTIAKGCTDDELSLFLAVARRTGLDPFARQIYAIKRWDSREQREVMVIQTGIDGFRATGHRTKEAAGVDEATFGPDILDPGVEPNEEGNRLRPDWAKVSVYRMIQGQRCPFTHKVFWREFAQKDKQGRYMGRWKDGGYNQLAKCAEAGAWRKGFSQEIAGLEFSTDEAPDEGAVIDLEAIAGPSRPSLSPAGQRGAAGSPGATVEANQHPLLMACPDHDVPWFKEGRMRERAHKLEGDVWCNRPRLLSRIMQEAREAAEVSPDEALEWCKETFGRPPSGLTDEERVQAMDHWISVMRAVALEEAENTPPPPFTKDVLAAGRGATFAKPAGPPEPPPPFDLDVPF